MNNFQLAVRRMRRTPLHSLVMLASITIGLASCLLVATFVINENSYDHSWPKYRDLYRITSYDPEVGTLSEVSPWALGPNVVGTVPDVANFCRISSSSSFLRLNQSPDGVTTSLLIADSTIFDMLTLQVKEGHPQKVVWDVQNLVITETFRKKYFANENPIGKTIKEAGAEETAGKYLITGVIADLPQQSHLRGEAIIVRSFKPGREAIDSTGETSLTQQYLQLSSGADALKVASLITAFYASRLHVTWRLPEFRLQKMADIYLHSDFAAGQAIQGNSTLVLVLSGISFLLLIIGCLNYINLSTANAINQAPESSLRRILGADRSNLIAQFLADSIVYFIISTALGIFLAWVSVPWLEELTSRPISINLLFSSRNLLLAAAGFVGITFLTGLYPAILLSRARPGSSGMTQSGISHSRNFARSILVVVQFALAVGLLVFTIGVTKQMKLLLNAPVGYDAKHLIEVPAQDWGRNGAAFRSALINMPGVEGLSFTGWYPGVGGANMSRAIKDPSNPGKEFTANIIFGDPAMGSVLGLKLLQGRWLDASRADDMPNIDSLYNVSMVAASDAMNRQSLLLTAASAKRLGVQELGRPTSGLPGIPVGIVADFHNQSLKMPVGITIVAGISTKNAGNLIVRFSASSGETLLSKIETQFRHYYPETAFQGKLVMDDLARQYESERQLEKILVWFSCLGVCLGGLGLLGLTAYLIRSRIREVGIRKVLGASTANLSAKLTWHFFKWVVLGACVAFPIAAWTLQRWLYNYDTRITLTSTLFIEAFLMVSGFAISITLFQTVRAANANPVKALKQDG